MTPSQVIAVIILGLMVGATLGFIGGVKIGTFANTPLPPVRPSPIPMTVHDLWARMDLSPQATYLYSEDRRPITGYHIAKFDGRMCVFVESPEVSKPPYRYGWGEQ